MSWEASDDKVDVVRRYLAACFPEGTVVHGGNFEETAELFYVMEQTMIRYRAAVARDVLEELSGAELAELLAARRLADRMRQEAPHRVTLTKEGAAP